MIAGTLIWTIPYAVTYSIALALTTGFPTDVTSYIIFAITVAITGIYGIFIREVTKFVVRAHPIQTTIYVSIFSGIILTVVFLLVFVLASIPSFTSMGSEGVGWAMVVLYVTVVFFFPLTTVSSFVSMLVSQVFPPTEDRTKRGWTTRFPP
jgi:hypothetical protein